MEERDFLQPLHCHNFFFDAKREWPNNAAVELGTTMMITPREGGKRMKC